MGRKWGLCELINIIDQPIIAVKYRLETVSGTVYAKHQELPVA